MAPPASATLAARPGRAASPAQKKHGAAAPATDENAVANVQIGAGPEEAPRGAAEVSGVAAEAASVAPRPMRRPMGRRARTAAWMLFAFVLGLSAAAGFCLGARGQPEVPCAKVIETVRSVGAEAGIEGVACVSLMCLGPLVFRLCAWAAGVARKLGATARKEKAI